MPAISASASRDASGKIHVSFANCDLGKSITVACTLDGVTAKSVAGRVLTAGAMNAHNTFADPHAVAPAAFDGAKLDSGSLSVTLPAKSVVMLELN
jgi:alpha-N-arabinofuranosidase